MIPPKLRIVGKVTLYLDDELISGIEPNMYASRETGAWYMFDEAVEGSTNEFKDYKVITAMRYCIRQTVLCRD